LVIVFGGVDLGRGKLAARLHFGSVELHDHVAGFQDVPFPGENLFNAAGRTRGDVHFIHFDRAGNGVAWTATTGQQRDRANGNGERETHQNLRDIMCWKPYETKWLVTRKRRWPKSMGSNLAPKLPLWA